MRRRDVGGVGALVVLLLLAAPALSAAAQRANDSPTAERADYVLG